MSFEGYEEWLCENGHYHAEDVHSVESEKVCPFCKAPFKWYHLVDQTNGMYKSDPSTFAAPKVETGFDDEWKQDHHGNHYAVKHEKYQPAPNSTWKEEPREEDDKQRE